MWESQLPNTNSSGRRKRPWTQIGFSGKIYRAVGGSATSTSGTRYRGRRGSNSSILIRVMFFWSPWSSSTSNTWRGRGLDLEKGEDHTRECPWNQLLPEGSPSSPLPKGSEIWIPHEVKALRLGYNRTLAMGSPFLNCPLATPPPPSDSSSPLPADLGDLVDQMDCECIRTKLQWVQQGSVRRKAWTYASLPPVKWKG